MRFAVDTKAVENAGGLTAGAADRMAAIDLAGVGDAIRVGMPGARASAAAADALLGLPRMLSALAAGLTDESGRLRLAASQYAAADAVARAGATAARSPAPGHPSSPGLLGAGR